MEVLLNANEIYAAWRAARGEEQGRLEGALYAELQKYAYAIVWTKYRNHPNPKDLVKTAVAKGIEKMGSFRGESKFLTWFRRIVENVCNDELRNKQVRKEQALDESVEVEGNVVAAADARLTLYGMLDTLDEEDKQFVQWKLEEWTESEIAKVTGLTVEGVRSRWDRIKKRLRNTAAVTARSMGTGN